MYFKFDNVTNTEYLDISLHLPLKMKPLARQELLLQAVKFLIFAGGDAAAHLGHCLSGLRGVREETDGDKRRSIFYPLPVTARTLLHSLCTSQQNIFILNICKN